MVSAPSSSTGVRDSFSGDSLPAVAQVAQQIGPPGGHAQQLVHVRRAGDRRPARSVQAFADPQQGGDARRSARTGGCDSGGPAARACGRRPARAPCSFAAFWASRRSVTSTAMPSTPDRRLRTRPAAVRSAPPAAVPSIRIRSPGTPPAAPPGGRRWAAGCRPGGRGIRRSCDRRSRSGCTPNCSRPPPSVTSMRSSRLVVHSERGALAITASSTAGSQSPGAGGSAPAPRGPLPTPLLPVPFTPTSLVVLAELSPWPGMLARSLGPANHLWVLSAA